MLLLSFSLVVVLSLVPCVEALERTSLAASDSETVWPLLDERDAEQAADIEAMGVLDVAIANDSRVTFYSLNIVPEPSTGMLFVLGFASLLLRRVRGARTSPPASEVS